MGYKRFLNSFSQFDDGIATALNSTSKATVIEKIDSLLECAKSSNRNYHDGMYWVYNSYTDWQKNYFPYWDVRTVKRVFKWLEEMGILITANYNKSKIDRTKWYSINYGKLGEIVDTELKAKGQNVTMPHRKDGDKMSPTIPYISNKYIDKKVTSVDFGKSTWPMAYVRRYGEERMAPMMDFVDWYIDKGYPKRMGLEHKKEDARARFSAKLLDFSDVITQDDGGTIDTVEKALASVTIEDHDPTIYWATSPKVLGYWAEKTGHTFYDELLGTEYQYVEDAYGRG